MKELWDNLTSPSVASVNQVLQQHATLLNRHEAWLTALSPTWWYTAIQLIGVATVGAAFAFCLWQIARLDRRVKSLESRLASADQGQAPQHG